LLKPNAYDTIMTESRKIRVLVVDDSPSVLDLLTYILHSDPQIEVIGTALTGKRALKFLESNRPDIITMDMDMPEMNGLEATRIIMESDPIPIIIVSASWSPSEVDDTYRALEAGAVSIMAKPRGIGHPDHNRMAIELISIVKTMSEVKLVRRWSKKREVKEEPFKEILSKEYIKHEIKIIAMGASTGGPPVIHTILSKLPKNLPVPMLIVQHIAKGFLEGFRDWLVKSTGYPVHIASNREKLIPGISFIAPNDFQMEVTADGTIHLNHCDPGSFLCPSVSCLFQSVSEIYGKNAMGILLTGMGKDGARELKVMRDKGAVTVAQDETSSVIYGMPGEAVKLGAAKYIMSPEQIVKMIIKLTHKA
jgi:two-component system chemotaxis response regulator CheB